MTGIVDRIRKNCAWVAGRATHVQVRPDRITAYAVALPPPSADPVTPRTSSPEAERAFWLTLDAINFGSGWFPTLRKPPGRSGYFTIHDGLRRRFDQSGPWTAGDLAVLKAGEIAHTLGQHPEHELMRLFARSLNDLGDNLIEHHEGSFDQAIASSAVQQVEALSRWDCFADASSYENTEIPFLKRAQIAAADLARNGLADFQDMHRLTMFADNLVPHVLRLDGILEFDRQLIRRIDSQQLIEHGSPEEVEIRACAVHAVELLAHETGRTAAEIDRLLWDRGGRPHYKAAPRHRSRCTAY